MTPGQDLLPTAPSPGQRWRAWLPRMLVESLLIVFSVLVALAVDEWRDERQRRDRAERAMRSIAAELRQNRSNVARALANHRAMADSVSAYAARRQPPPQHVYLNGLFNPGLVHSAAWEAALETGATADMPYERVIDLSSTYDRQARYRALGDALVEDVMRQIRLEGLEPVLRDGAPGFLSLQTDFANRERILLATYDSALAALPPGGNEGPPR